jgi:hypothetical protein
MAGWQYHIEGNEGFEDRGILHCYRCAGVETSFRSVDRLQNS